MKQFKGVKPLEQIKESASKKGFIVDTKRYDAGSDFFMIKDSANNRSFVVNSFNGQFGVHDDSTKEIIATHLSDELDDVDWYKELLDVIYEPAE